MKPDQFTVVEESKDEASGRHLRIVELHNRRDPAYAIHELGGQFHPADEWHVVHRLLSDLADARETTRLMHLHTVELRALDRKEMFGSEIGKSTPWGKADSGTIYGPGVVAYGTSRHGGFKLDAKANSLVHPALRNKGGWYEEDCEWAKVGWTFQALFTTMEVSRARKSLIEWLPHEFMAATGEVLGLADSRKLREEAFAAATVDKWVVISALGRDDGDVTCIATLGGQREQHDGPAVEERTFIVPKAEYGLREFNFVIDEARHREIEVASPSP